MGEEDLKQEVQTIRALTTLLLQSRLNLSGNPLTSFPHLPRKQEIPFLNSRIGKRLFQMRQVSERAFVLDDSPQSRWTSLDVLLFSSTLAELQDASESKVTSLIILSPSLLLPFFPGLT